MACSRSKVVPKISSHRAGWIARVASSVRSWRIFWISTRQKVAMRLPSHRHAGGEGGGADAASPEAAGGRRGATDGTEAPARPARGTGAVTAHLLQPRHGPEARLRRGLRGP